MIQQRATNIMDHWIDVEIFVFSFEFRPLAGDFVAGPQQIATMDAG